MANMRAIRTRIKSVQNTQQITKAMKLVAASKLRKAQNGMIGSRPFADSTQQVLDALMRGNTNAFESIYTQKRKEVKKVLYAVCVGNRGLCGMYNNEVMRFMENLAAEETHDYEVIVLGRWGADLFRKSKMNVVQIFNELGDIPTNDDAHMIASYLKKRFAEGEVDEVRLVYAQYISALSQKPVVCTLLPLEGELVSKEESGKDNSEEEEKGGTLEFEFLPDQASVLDSILELHINHKVFATMLEARCGEHSARMTAMSAATDNTKTLIDALTLSMNRARQAAITTEISEIVGGANALHKKEQ